MTENMTYCDKHVSSRKCLFLVWVFDTGYVAHICNSKQGLRIKRRLAKDEVTMRVGNGSKLDEIAVGTLPLHLPTGLVLNLNNCYWVPALTLTLYLDLVCSDLTRMDKVSVLKCHPWIGMLTHTVLEGFITEVNHMYKVT